MMTSLDSEEQLRLPLDRRGFLRRECPTCHRQFKLRWGMRDALLLQRRLGRLVVHGNAHEMTRGYAARRCPYCAYLADADDWWTEEQRVMLAKRAAALEEEIRYEQLRFVERTLAQNPAPTFVPVRPGPFTYRGRPEPDDMRVVPLVCCGEDVKVRESWDSRVSCPFCGIAHHLRP